MGTREERQIRTRRALESAALKLFADNGFDTTTMGEVAAAAGTSRSTAFRIFPTKEDLLFANQADDLAELRRLVAEARQAEDLRAALRKATVAFARHLERDDPTLALRARIIGSDARLLARATAIRGVWEMCVADELHKGRPGAEPTLEERVLATMCVGALYAAVATWRLRGERARLDRMVRDALRTACI